MYRIFGLVLVLSFVVGQSVGVADDGVSSDGEKTPIRVLVISGANNHDWKTTTPKVKELLEADGQFQVDVTERPDQLTVESLGPYDAIVSNWNNWSIKDKETVGVANWPETVRKAYLDFVSKGRGHVTLHAGGSSFYDWPEYHRLTLANWELGKTGHGPRHDFPVRVDEPDHPIMAGLMIAKSGDQLEQEVPDGHLFVTNDELWNRPGVHPDATVLASAFSDKTKSGGTGDYEPTVMVAPFGKGRAFTLMLGHDAECMNNPGFVALLKRGTEWAATGKVGVSAKHQDL